MIYRTLLISFSIYLLLIASTGFAETSKESTRTNLPWGQLSNTLATGENSQQKGADGEENIEIKPSEVSQSDRDFINRVRAGEINKKDNPEEFTPERVKLLKKIMRIMGADDKEIRELIPD
jgi:hypothetical protein